MGKTEEMKKLLKRNKVLFGHTAQKMAVHILFDEVDKAFELLPKVLQEAQYETKIRKIKEWPLFKHLRNDRRFITAFEQGLTQLVESEKP
jgi:hypothetical protein